MNLLGNIIEDFIFFSFLESAIFYLWFRLIWNCGKFTLKDIVIVGFVNCIISQIIPPLIYQIIMTIWMGLYLRLFKNRTLINGLFISLSAMLILLVVEMCFAMFYESYFNLNFMSLNKMKLFIAIIPIKFFEILFIIGGHKMKVWFSEIEKRK